MSEYIVVYAVIDGEREIACAALTQQEAEDIIRESEDGNLSLDRVYLYGEGILTGKLLKELKTLLAKETRGAYPCTRKFIAYLADQPLAKRRGGKRE